jgi:hypothetical protein
MFSISPRKKTISRPLFRRTPFQPSLERLEDRLVMSVSAEEQMFVYLLNRARNDPQYYAKTELAGYEEELTAGQKTAITLADYQRCGPLAVNDNLFASSGFKSTDLINHPWWKGQSTSLDPHQGSDGTWPNKLARAKGYALPWGFSDDQNNIESIQGGTMSAADALKYLIIDAGVEGQGHRKHLLGKSFQDHREVGVGHDGPFWVIHTAYRNSSDRFITGVVYNDLNGNKVYDLNEGLAGVDVYVGNTHVTTNAAGGYSLLVPEGTFLVSVEGAGFSGQASKLVTVGYDNVEVDFISGFTSGIVNFNFDQMVPVTVSINKFVQIDNPDGIGGQQGDYYALVTINGQLHRSHEIPGDIDLFSGPYTINPTDWTFTDYVDASQAPRGKVEIKIAIMDSDPWGNPDDVMDINPTAGKTDITVQFDLATGTWTGDVRAGQESYQGNGDPDSDRGRIFFEIGKTTIGQRQQALHQPSGTIEAYAWHDLNLNGIHERDVEPYQEGWTIYLDLNHNGVLDPTEPWQSSKNNPVGVRFSSLRPGETYTVAEVVKTSWYLTYPPHPGTHQVSVEPGQTAAVRFGNAQKGKILGRVWNDLNGNGKQDEGLARGLTDWEVYLDLNGNGRLDRGEPATKTSGREGTYMFEVPAGVYTVAEVLQSGWQQTIPGGKGTHAVQVNPNATVSGVDFGNQLIPTQQVQDPGLVADFGSAGLWHWTGTGGWQQLSPLAPSDLDTAGNGDIFADYGLAGLWRWTVAGGWQQLTPVDPTSLSATANGDLFAAFGVAGLWHWTVTAGWQQVSGANPSAMSATAGGDLFASFGPAGLWHWAASSGWKQLTSMAPSGFSVAGNGDLYTDYGFAGLWRWTATSGWQQLSPADPTGLSATTAGDLYAAFGGAGLYRWTVASGWQLLSARAPAELIAVRDVLFADFDAAGLYRWSSAAGWQQLTPRDPLRIFRG